MAKAYYTNVQIWGDNVLFRGFKNGKRVQEKIKFAPKLWVKDNSGKPSEWTTIHGEPLRVIETAGIKDAKKFIEQYKDVDGFEVYGNLSFEYAVMNALFPWGEEVPWKLSDLVIGKIDIEAGLSPSGGFAEPADASGPITAITLKLNSVYHVFGTQPWEHDREKCVYHQGHDEADMLRLFLDVWCSNYPDVITGWYIPSYDIPYLVNRIKRLLGEEYAKKLSPWGILREKEIEVGAGRDKSPSYSIYGISILDYLDLYKKFVVPATGAKESYGLNYISMEELGEGKLEYDGSLHNLYLTDYQTYMDYNWQDVSLIDKLENKLRLIELALILTYDTKCNFEDCFHQTRLWDAICTNKLLSEHKVVPPKKINLKTEKYEGAYVKKPRPGMYGWGVNFDATSLYPMTIIMYNISPETWVDPKDYTPEMRRIIAEGVTVDKLLNKEMDLSFLKEQKVCLTPNGQFFRTDKQGFFPQTVQQMFDQRKAYKDQMKVIKKQHKDTKNDELLNEIKRLDLLQQNKKVSANSSYGAAGNEWFRFYMLELAMAVTLGGQLSIKWEERNNNRIMNKLMGTKDVDYCIYIDTDGKYLDLAALIARDKPNASQQEICDYIDKLYDNIFEPSMIKAADEIAEYTNAFRNTLDMKIDCIWEQAIWVAKKSYVLKVWEIEKLRYDEPQTKITGLSLKKSSTPTVCRSKLKECLNLILNTNEDTVLDYIAKFRKEFDSFSLDQIAFPRGVNDLEKYRDDTKIYSKGTPIHVRASLLHNYYVEKNNLSNDVPMIRSGDKVKYVYLKEPNIYRENIMGFITKPPKEFDLENKVDYTTQYEKAFLEPIKGILDVIGWKHKRVISLFKVKKAGNE